MKFITLSTFLPAHNFLADCKCANYCGVYCFVEFIQNTAEGLQIRNFENSVLRKSLPSNKYLNKFFQYFLEGKYWELQNLIIAIKLPLNDSVIQAIVKYRTFLRVILFLCWFFSEQYLWVALHIERVRIGIFYYFSWLYWTLVLRKYILPISTYAWFE